MQRLIGPFILRRLKTDPKVIADLPEKNEMKVFRNLTKEQVSLYAAVVDEANRALDGADGIQRKGVITWSGSSKYLLWSDPTESEI